MSEKFIHRVLGRHAFGHDPGGYDAARPAYPEWVFDVLRDRCGLAPHAAVFEIGAGTGTATRRLLEQGADPLIAIEPDERMARFLRNSRLGKACAVVVAPFEEAVLQESSFNLGVSATSFHWLNEEQALKKVARLLLPGGWWAMVWNVFGDADRADPFHEATKSVLEGPLSPSAGNGEVPFALDAGARIGALERAGEFDCIEQRCSAWTLTLDEEQTVAIYATFSNVNLLPNREAVLDELRRIAVEEFGGRVQRNMVTSLYVAQRRSSAAR
jgi:SAM-dependent methyltransferase